MLTTEVTFDNPPVNEVVIATYFNPPILDFRSEHVGLFWEKVKDAFPVVRQQIPVGGVGPDIGPDEPFPMPRYWFVANDDINLVQVQKNAFMFNWRRRGQNQYPGFQDVKRAFDRLYGQFENFLRQDIGTSEVSIDLCELTYIDAIEQCDYWRRPEDTCNVIPSFSIPLADSDASTRGFDCRYIYRSSEDITISNRVWTMGRPGESGRLALGLEMKATKRFDRVQKTITDDWFTRAHETILKHFIDMTSEDVQREHWGLRKRSIE